MEQPTDLSELEPVKRSWRRTPGQSGGWIRTALRLLLGVALLGCLALPPWENLMVNIPGSWGEMLGGLHHLLHYLPVAFVLAAVVLQVADVRLDSLGMDQAVCRLLALGWVSALAALAAGLMLAWSEPRDADALTWHRVGGIVFAVLVFQAWILKRGIRLRGREDRALAYQLLMALLLPVLLAACFCGRMIDTDFARMFPVRFLAGKKAVGESPEQQAHTRLVHDLQHRWPGMLLQPIREGRPELALWRTAPGAAFGNEDLEELAPLAQDILWLDLSQSSITDPGTVALSGMSGLVRLKLGYTAITDASASRLAALPRLEYLDLSGTGITDKGLQELARSRSLHRLVLWQTAVTPGGALPVARSRPDLVLALGWERDRSLRQLLARADLGENGFDASIREGLVLHLPFDGNVEDATASRTLSLPPFNDPAYREGVEGQALAWTKEQGLAYGTDVVFDRNRPCTVSFWLQVSEIDGLIISQRSKGPAWQGVEIGLDQQQLTWACFARAPDDGIRVTGTRPLALGTWHHVAVVYDGSSRASGVRIYVDGQPELLETARDQLTGSLRAVRPLVVGAMNELPGFSGVLDDLRIHDRMLGPDAIAYLARKKVP